MFFLHIHSAWIVIVCLIGDDTLVILDIYTNISFIFGFYMFEWCFFNYVLLELMGVKA